MDDLDLRTFEDGTRRDVAAGLRASLEHLDRTLTGVYVVAAGSTHHKLPPHAQDTVRRHLVDVLTALEGYDYAATRRVLRTAARTATVSGGEDLDERVSPVTPLDVRWALKDLTAGMRADLRAARQLAKVGSVERYGDIQAIIGAAKKALNRADRTATWVVHRAHNEGRMRAADRAERRGEDVLLMWRAERDACVRCSGFAGALARPGEPFYPVFEAADASAGTGPLMGPWDAHPFCRCSLERWHGPAEVGPVDLPYALRREAQRAVLSGAAQGSEPARVRAAERLLDAADLLVPKTARKRAAGAVAAGTFER